MNRSSITPFSCNSFKSMMLLKQITLISLISIAFLFFYMINHIYPLCSDDYGYSYIYGQNNRVTCVADILKSQAAHWRGWNGRFIAHSTAQYFLMFDKFFFNVFNTICYASCSLLISVFAGKRFSLFNWLIVVLTLWVMMPHPGSSIFWLTGSCNYIWSSCLCTAYLWLLFSDSKQLPIYSLLFALPAGNSHEGIALGVLVTSILFGVLRREKRWIYYISLSLFIIGFLSNCFAPGNYVRLESHNVNTAFSIIGFCKSCLGTFVYVAFNTSDIGLKLCCIEFAAILIYSIIWMVRKIRNQFSQTSQDCAIALVAGASSLFAFCVFINVINPRALYGFAFLTHLSALCILFTVKHNTLLQSVTFIMSALLCVFEFPKLYSAVNNLARMIPYVASVAKNSNIVEAPPFWSDCIKSRYVERYGLGECCLNNAPFAKYHNTLPFIVVGSEVYRSIMEQSNLFDNCSEGDTINSKNGVLYYCIGTKPKKVCCVQKISNGNEQTRGRNVMIWNNKYFALCCSQDIQIQITYKDGTTATFPLKS